MTDPGDGAEMVGVQTKTNGRPGGKDPASGRGPSTRWISLLLLCAGLAILIAFAATTNLRQVAGALRNADGLWLLLAAGAVAAQILVKAVRWQFMVERLTGTRISLGFGAVSVVSGVAAGSMTPGRSFELAKAVMLRGSYNIALSVSTSAMIVERMLDMAFLVVTFLLAAAFVPTRTVLASRVLALVVAGVIVGFGALVVAPGRIRAWITPAIRLLPLPAPLRDRSLGLLDTFFTSFLLLRAQHTLWTLLAFTAASAALDVGRVVAVFTAMGIGLSIPVIVFAYLGAAMLGMALLIPGGVGVTEVSMAGLIAVLAPGAVSAPLVSSAVLADRFLSYYLLVVLGAGLLVAYHRFRHVAA
jgi:glycosyltransferase 2 family protein